MNNFGLYVADTSRQLEGTEYNWTRHTLFKNGEHLVTTTDEKDTWGLVADGKKLLINGEVIAESTTDEDCKIDADLNFGDVDLDGHVQCINVTKENYLRLYKGEMVGGYKKYDPQAVYNFVDNVATAPVVTCVKPSKGRDFLYCNIVSSNDGGLCDNVLTDATFAANRTPQLSVHDVSLRVEITDGVCEPVTLMYMVDTKHLDKLHFDKFEDTFTVIVKDCNGDVLYKNTTYAGEFWIEFNLYKNRSLPVSNEETYFSIECIDNHGVGSIVQFVEIGVFNHEEENFYDVEEHIDDDITATTDSNNKITSLSFEYDSSTYILYLDDDNKTHAYHNKLAFTALFNKAKAAGYNGIKLYNADTTGDNPTTYYITYQKDISSPQNPASPDLGSQTYYVATTSGYVPKNGSTAAVAGSRVTDLIPIIQGVSTDFPNDEEYVVVTENSDITAYKVNGNPLDFIKRDFLSFHRVPTTTDTSSKIYPHQGKILVKWKDDGRGWTDERKAYDGVGLGDTSNLRAYNYETELWCGKNDEPNKPSSCWDGADFNEYYDYALRTIRVSATNIYCADGQHYFVQNTEDFGDLMLFPDNFTVDMNRAVFQATQNIGVSGGYIIGFNGNNNTHIKNGTVSGLYKGYDFKGAYLAGGYSSLGVSEALSNIRNYGSRYCSIENVESRYSVGYDCINYDWKNGAPTAANGSTQAYFSFSNAGYISLDGTIKTTPSVRTVTFNDSDYDEGLVYESDYHSWGFTYGGNASDECYIGCLYLVPFMNGKEHELFMHFYHYNSSTTSYEYISSIKTAFWNVIKCPAGTTHYRISAYGILDYSDGNYISKTAKLFNTNHYINVAFYDFTISCWSNKESHGMLYKNIYSHHHKSTAFSSETSGVTYDGCVFEAAGCIPYTDWFVTKLLGATEDGRYHTKLFTVKNNTFIRLYNGEQTSTNITDTVSFSFIYGRNMSVINNKGLSMTNFEGVKDVYVANNNFRTLSVSKGSPYSDAHFVYKDNNVYISYTDSRSYTPDVTKKINSKDAPKYTSYGIRINNCDEPVSELVTMRGMFLVSPTNNRNCIQKLKTRYIGSKIADDVLNQSFTDIPDYYRKYYYFNYFGSYDGHSYRYVSETTGEYVYPKFDGSNYIPIIISGGRNPVNAWRIVIDGIPIDMDNSSAAKRTYGSGGDDDYHVAYINNKFIPARENNAEHNIFYKVDSVSINYGRIVITADNKIIVPEHAHTLNNLGGHYFCQRFCFDGTNGVLVFLSSTPPYFEIGYRADGDYKVMQVTSLSQVASSISSIKVPIGSEQAYRDMLASTSKRSCDQSFLNSLVVGCTYEELLAEYPSYSQVIGIEETN